MEIEGWRGGLDALGISHARKCRYLLIGLNISRIGWMDGWMTHGLGTVW